MNIKSGSLVSTLIVNYRTPVLTIKCIESILQFGICPEDRVVVVDNCSADGSVDQIKRRFPSVHVIANLENRGYGAGLNVAAKHTVSDYFLVLNPDTYFRSNTITGVVSYLDHHPDVGIAGLDLHNPDGSRQYSARSFYSYCDIAIRRISLLRRVLAFGSHSHLMAKSWRQGEPFNADWVMGTGFLMRSELFKLLGGMDERYFLYMEDVDLCARVWCEGYSVRAIPGAYLVHDHQRSSANSIFSKSAQRHWASLMIFANTFHVPFFFRATRETIKSHAKKKGAR